MNQISVGNSHPLLPKAPRINRCFIDGQWLEGNGWISRASPAHGVEISRTVKADATMVDAAVAAARKAFDTTDWPHIYA
ncbi:MAG: hypothetical protein ACC634_03935, partial [Hyphomicrobiales bacterium]